jgi:hypothetical protein
MFDLVTFAPKRSFFWRSSFSGDKTKDGDVLLENLYKS